MARWIFHVGYSKTGTTAVQGLLAANRAGLRRQGILYPDARYAGLQLGLENHNAVAAALTEPPAMGSLSAETYFRQFDAQAALSPRPDLVILSAEGFTGHPNVLLYDTETDFRAAEDRYVARLRALAGTRDTRIVVYLRRQDHWLNSTANQRIKFEGRNAGPAFDTMERFYARQKPRLDYLASLACWSRHFGAENITVRPYERGQLAGGSVTDDFLQTAGIGHVALDAPARGAPANPGLSRDVLEFKKRLNPTLGSRFEIEVTGDLLARVSAEMGGDSGQLIEPALRRAILEACAAGNQEIARRYLDRADGRLFHEPWPAPDDLWEPYPGLSAGAEAEIARRLDAQRTSLSGRAFVLRKRISTALQDKIPQVHLLARALHQNLSRH